MATSKKTKSYNKLTDDTRTEVIANIVNQKRPLSEVSTVFGIPRSTVWNIVSTYKKTKRVEPVSRSGGRKRKFTDDDASIILKLASSSTEISLKKIKKEYEDQRPGQSISISTIHSILKKTNSNAKSFFVDEFVSNSPQSKEQRQIYADHFLKLPDVTNNSLYSGVLVIDLSSSVFTPISYGDFQCKGSIYIMVSLYVGGIYNHVVQVGTMQAKVFDNYLTTTLKEVQSRVPDFKNEGYLFADCLKYLEESRISLIAQQAGFHASVIPAFSSFLSPIEYLRKKLNDKVIISKADQDSLIAAVDSALGDITSSDCKGWIDYIKNTHIKACANKEDFAVESAAV